MSGHTICQDITHVTDKYNTIDMHEVSFVRPHLRTPEAVRNQDGFLLVIARVGNLKVCKCSIYLQMRRWEIMDIVARPAGIITCLP